MTRNEQAAFLQLVRQMACRTVTLAMTGRAEEAAVSALSLADRATELRNELVTDKKHGGKRPRRTHK